MTRSFAKIKASVIDGAFMEQHCQQNTGVLESNLYRCHLFNCKS